MYSLLLVDVLAPCTLSVGVIICVVYGIGQDRVGGVVIDTMGAYS